MPTRIYPIRPLYRRGGYYGAQPQGSGFNAAEAFKGLPALGEAIAKGMAQKKLDVQANQLMTPPNQPVDKLGTLGDEPLVNQIVNPPFTGGLAGMKLQQEFIRSQLQNQDLAAQINQRRLAARVSGGGGGGAGGNAARWQQYLGGGGQPGQAGKAGKPAAYVAGSSTPDQPNYYNFNNQRADVDAQYGKGTHDRLLAGAGSLGPPDAKTGVRTTADGTVDAQGNVTKPPSMTVDKDGNVTLAPKGNYPGAYLPADQVQTNMARNDATAVRQGASPRFTDQYLKTQNPQAGLPGGDAANPYTPKSTLDLNAIAPGKWFVNPQDGKVNQKLAPGQQPPAQQPPAKGTAQVDTGDQSQQVAGAQPPPQTQVPSLLQPLPGGQPQTPQQGLAGAQDLGELGRADQGQGQDYTGGQPQLSPVDQSAMVASNTPSSFDLGQPTGGGLPQDQGLADEIKRSQMANYLQGVA